MNTPAQTDNPPSRWGLWLLLLLLVTAAVYAPSFRNGHTYDDGTYVRAPTAEGHANSMVQEWQGLTEYFRSWYGKDTGTAGRGFRPVTVMSFALGHQMSTVESTGGLGAPAPPPATVQHVVNVALFLLAVLVCFALLARFVGRSWPAVLGAAVFALHAVRSDAVISTVGRAETMAFLFGGLASLIYLGALRRRGAMRLLLVLGAAACNFLAFSSKESALAWVFFAPLLALALGWQDKNWQGLVRLRSQMVPWLLAALLPAAVFGYLMYAAVAGRFDDADAVSTNLLSSLSTPMRLANAVMILAYGLYKVVFPFSVACDYTESFALIQELGDYRLWLSVAVLLTFLGLGLVLARRRPLLFLAVAAFFGFAFVTSNIPMAVETIFGERLLFTPAIALSFLVAGIAARLARSPERRSLRLALSGLLGLWLLGGAFIIVRQCFDWQSNATLFPVSANRQPHSSLLQVQAATHYRVAGHRVNFEGKEGEALRYKWRQCTEAGLKANPESVFALEDLAAWHVLRGQSMIGTWKSNEAAGHFQKAKSYIARAFASPRYSKRINGPSLHQMLGDMHQMAGDQNAAIAAFQESIAADPTRHDTYRHLAQAYYGWGKPEKGIELLRQGLAKNPGSIGLRELVMRTTILEENWQRFDALMAKGKKEHGDDPVLSILLGRKLLAQGHTKQAIEPLRTGLQQLPLVAKPYDWMKLAAALKQLDRKNEARRILQAIVDGPRTAKPARKDAQEQLQALGDD